ncbi:MAG: RsmE family RNA methyltransferase [Deltaproteobacteria bacterium]|jgi:16S rRNA (uracil1498-N3)-methyltransferase|nr:RsmE family RNA methyltransferase [Deltaproteobacteria bacterium]
MYNIYLPLEDLLPNQLVKTDSIKSHHLIHVLKVKQNDRFRIFNGHGQRTEASLEKINRNHCQLRISPDEVKKVPRAANRLFLYFSLVKKKTLPAILRQAVESGVNELIPVVSENSVLPPIAFEGKKTRWQKIIISAAEQSGRCYLPHLHSPLHFTEIFQKTSNLNNKFIFTLKNQQANPRPKQGDSALLVGPEGGFTKAEINTALDEGFFALNLGKYTLRADTACLAAVIKFQTLEQLE